MTYEEVMDQYGDVDLKFSSYYKYTFTYCGEKNEVNICHIWRKHGLKRRRHFARAS